MNPLVSVVIPTYNCSAFIKDALDSVFGQNYSPMEVIVIDDGSTDGTPEAIGAYANTVKLVRQSNRGPAAARNRGIEVARGQYIAFLDGDDCWLPGKISAQVQAGEAHPEMGIIAGQFARWYPDVRGLYPSWENLLSEGPEIIGGGLTGWLYPELLLDVVIHTITTLIRREVLETVNGFDESLRTGEDYDLWLRCAREYPMLQLPLPTALYRIRPDSTTVVKRPTNNEYLVLRRALERWGMRGPDGREVDHGALSSRLARMCFNHGYQHYWGGDALVARRAFMDARRHRPFWWRNWFYLALSMLKAEPSTKAYLQKRN
jgi:glycosyltransferase involved in cell wall biosynthesis